MTEALIAALVLILAGTLLHLGLRLLQLALLVGPAAWAGMVVAWQAAHWGAPWPLWLALMLATFFVVHMLTALALALAMNWLDPSRD